MISMCVCVCVCVRTAKHLLLWPQIPQLYGSLIITLKCYSFRYRFYSEIELCILSTTIKAYCYTDVLQLPSFSRELRAFFVLSAYSQ